MFAMTTATTPLARSFDFLRRGPVGTERVAL